MGWEGTAQHARGTLEWPCVSHAAIAGLMQAADIENARTNQTAKYPIMRCVLCIVVLRKALLQNKTGPASNALSFILS